MGLPVVVDVRDEHVAPGVVDRVFDWLRFVDATFSPYRPDSEISRLDRGELALRDAHRHVAEVVERCEQLRLLTGGWFDARAPLGGPLDPSGLVKGWAVDRAAALLEAGGAHRFCVNAGGDLRLSGAPGPRARWRVGIQHPERRRRVAAVLTLTDAAVATSGTYERGAHIIDPHTGEPPSGTRSVTVVGPDLATADAFATAAFAMGEDGPAWTAGLPGYDAMTILDGGRVLCAPGLLRHCEGGSVAASLASRAAQAPSAPGSAGTSTACCRSASSGTRSRARSWVEARTT